MTAASSRGTRNGAGSRPIGRASRRGARESAARGMLRGIGIANAIESAGGPHRKPLEEGAEIRFDSGGIATILLGSHNHGQGHETVFRQIIATRLGMPPDGCGSSLATPTWWCIGRGTIGSRSMMAAGGALVGAAEKVIAQGKQIAAHLLEAAEVDMEFADGRLPRSPAPTAASASRRCAKASYVPGALPRWRRARASAGAVTRPGDATFPNGCHIAEVEVDPETGEIDGCSPTPSSTMSARVINPLLVKGQIHGGVAQGFGQALRRGHVYDAERPVADRLASWTTRCRAPATLPTSRSTSNPCRRRPTRSASRAPARPARSARCRRW